MLCYSNNSNNPLLTFYYFSNSNNIPLSLRYFSNFQHSKQHFTILITSNPPTIYHLFNVSRFLRQLFVLETPSFGKITNLRIPRST